VAGDIAPDKRWLQIIAPQCDTVFHICVEGNGFEGEKSADAAGITASHAEAGTILAAID